MKNENKTLMEYYAELEGKTQDLLPKVSVMTDSNQIEFLISQLINIDKLLDECITESEKKLTVATKKQQKAKKYHAKPYKIGSDKKKAGMLAEAQVAMMEALTCLQKGQVVMFKFQQVLASFSRKCMSLCLSNQIDINDLANILLEYDRESDEIDLPNGVYAEILQLKQEIESLSKLHRTNL